MTAARLDHTFFDREVRPQLGSILLDKGFVTAEQLERALAERAQAEELLGETLVRLGYVFEEDLARVHASRTCRSTFARFPSVTGIRPPNSSLTSSIGPDVLTVRNPKSDRKSRGKIVLCTWNRSYCDSPSG